YPVSRARDLIANRWANAACRLQGMGRSSLFRVASGRGRHAMIGASASYAIGLTPSYLREQAHRCVRLARDCPHLPTSQELEAIGVELMEKASELDHLLEVRHQ